MERIPTLATSDLLSLLDKSLPFLMVEELRSVPIAILSKLDTIPSHHIPVLSTNPKLLELLPIKVKRQVWTLTPKTWSIATRPCILTYITNPTRQELLYQYFWDDCGLHGGPDTWTWKNGHSNAIVNMFLHKSNAYSPSIQRAADSALQQLVKMVGKNVSLYDHLLRDIRVMFVKSGSLALCALRLDLLLSFHDAGIQEICSHDKCYELALCLNNACTQNQLDVSIAKEMHRILSRFDDGNSILGDVSMIFSHPCIRNLVLQQCMHGLQEVLEQEQLPKEHATLPLLVQILRIGAGAMQTLSTKVFIKPFECTLTITALLPLISNMMLLTLCEEKEEFDPLLTELCGLHNSKAVDYIACSPVETQHVFPTPAGAENIQNRRTFLPLHWSWFNLPPQMNQTSSSLSQLHHELHDSKDDITKSVHRELLSYYFVWRFKCNDKDRVQQLLPFFTQLLEPANANSSLNSSSTAQSQAKSEHTQAETVLMPGVRCLLPALAQQLQFQIFNSAKTGSSTLDAQLCQQIIKQIFLAKASSSWFSFVLLLRSACQFSKMHQRFINVDAKEVRDIYEKLASNSSQDVPSSNVNFGSIRDASVKADASANSASGALIATSSTISTAAAQISIGGLSVSEIAREYWTAFNDLQNANNVT
jgi:hypothetical protein